MDVSQTLLFANGGFLQGAGQLLHNNSLGVRLQQVYRVTVGTALDALEMGAGAAYVDQDFGASEPGASFGAVTAHETLGITLPFPVAGTLFTQTARALLPVGERDAKQLTWSVEIRAPISPSIGLSWSIWSDYIENAPEKRDKTYLKTSFGLSWTFTSTP